MRFQNVGGRVFVGTGKVRLRGWERPIEVPMRVDARSAGDVRVDYHDGICWVAADRGYGFPTVREAKAYASEWLAAARSQATLSPRIEREAA